MDLRKIQIFVHVFSLFRIDKKLYSKIRTFKQEHVRQIKHVPSLIKLIQRCVYSVLAH